jgi:hypothetical protein
MTTRLLSYDEEIVISSMHFRFLLTIVLSFFSANSLLAQRYQVFDATTKEAIPFVKVKPQNSAPFLADLSGTFELADTVRVISLKILGYSDSTIELAAVPYYEIFLQPKAQELNEIVVAPGLNPALRIIELAIANRKENHPQAHGGFIAEQYSKFVFDIDDETKRILAAKEILPEDTNRYEFKQFTERQAFFISESVSKHYFEPPYREKESIEAYRVSGFTDPSLSSIAQSLQSFHFYEIQLEILGIHYLSPIAPGSLERYFYALKDTVISGVDTTFTIFFRPKKGADFSGLSGYLYINTHGYAIEKVQAYPYNPAPNTTKVAITQEYQLLPSMHWFPKQLITEVYVQFIQINMDSTAAIVVGKGLNVIRSVQFDPPELDKVKFQQISVETLPNAAQKLSEEEWQNVRVTPLNAREIRTYEQLDSLSKEEHFDQKLKLLKMLSSGKLPLGYAQIDLAKVLNYNAFEYTRFGLGIESSAKLAQHFKVGATFGYGLNDQRYKYSLFIMLHTGYANRFQCKAFRSADIYEVGAPVLYQTSMLYKQDATRFLYASNWVYQEKLGLELSLKFNANSRLDFETSLQRNTYTDNYRYQGQATSQGLMSRLTYNLAIREQSSYFGELLIPKPSPYPKIQLQVEHAWLVPNWTASLPAFNRIQLNVFQVATIPAWGVIQWNLRCSYTDRPTPLQYQHAISASRPLDSKQFGMSVANTFETLNCNAFYHQKQLQFFVRYIQNAWRTTAKWNEPQIGFHFAYGWGQLDQKALHSTSFLTMDKGYTELGLLVNGLLVSGNSSFGIGVFQAVGYYASPHWKQNLVPKFTIGYVF